MNNDALGQYQPGEIKFIRLLPGPIDRVWSYLTDSKKRSTWFAAGDMELRPGGKVELKFHHADFTSEEVPEKFKGKECGHGFESKITRCEPPRVLGFLFEEEEGDHSEVVFELSERGKDVQLTLTHSRLPNRRFAQSVSKGWHAHLDVLVAELNGQPTPPFWSKMIELEEAYNQKLEVAFPKG